MAQAKRDQNFIPALLGVSNADGITPVIVYADPTTHRLLVDTSVSLSSVTTAVATAVAPTYGEGTAVALSTDLSGALRVSGSLSVGGTTDNSAFTAGTSTGTPAMGFYHSTIDTVTDGRAASLAIDSKRNLFVTLRDAAGNARGVNVDANNNLGVVLGAETTKVIGVVRNSDGAGNLLTTNSTTYTAKFALDGNLLGTLGTAFSTAGKVDVKAADGDVFVRQATGTNLHMVLDSGTVTTVSASRTVGNGGAVLDAVNTAATAPANGVLTLGLYNSTEPSPTTGQSVGIQLDSKGRQRMVIMDAAGNTRGANIDANNNMGVVLAAETTKVLGTVRVLGNVGAIMDAATAATVPANALYSGRRGTTALPTAVSDGQMVGAMADKFGRQVVLPVTIRDLVGTQTTTISASTSETTVITAGAAGIFNDPILFLVSNTSATAVRVDFRDATAGSILFSLSVPATDVRGFSMGGVPVPQTTAANNWTAQSSASVTDLRVYAVYAKNK